MITHNDDILTQILLWLPAKSLIRFKLVSKSWLSLISSHYFSHLHTSRHRLSKPERSLLLTLPQTPNQYYYLQSALSKLVPYNFPSTFDDPKVCSFCNGLFLLHCSNDKQGFHVYNPTTKQSRQISFNTNEMYPIVAGLNIVFDPLKSPHCYKIVCVRFARRRISGFFSSSRPRRCQIEVYESDASTWKPCGDQFFAPSYMDFDHGIYWNNGVHWSGIFLDLDANVVREHPRFLVPDGDGIPALDVNYVEWNDCLYCVAHYPRQKLIAVFELQRDHREWILKHRIDLSPDFGAYSVLSIVGRYREEDSALLIHKPGMIMAYDFSVKSFKKVIGLPEEPFYLKNHVNYRVQCVEGLTCLFLETLCLV